MRRSHSLLLALAACLPLAGCYYDPGYGYVRNGSGGDAYYGTQTTTTVVQPGGGYYDDGYGYYPGYSTVGVGAVYYSDGYNRRYYRDRDYRDDHGRPPPPGGWHGRPGDGDHRPPPGGWQGGNRPPGGGGPRPPGVGHDGDRPPPPGGWNGGGGRPPPPSNTPSRGPSRPTIVGPRTGPPREDARRGGGNRDSGG